MNDIGNGILLEDDSGNILLEDGINILMLESSQNPDGQEIGINNYLFVKADDGISVTEKIR